MTAGFLLAFTFLFFLASRRLDLWGCKINSMCQQLKRPQTYAVCGIFIINPSFKKSTPRLMGAPCSLSPYYQNETRGVPSL